MEKKRRSREERLNDYEGFVAKFKPKKTTDDCYTPPAVYEAVRGWVDANVTPLSGRRVVRPFYPGGDYESFDYREGDIVLDNPPFSILAKIRRFYAARGIDYFLFAPGLTLFSSPVSEEECFIVTGESVTYENGAQVPTGFVTNCVWDGTRIWVSAGLSAALRAVRPAKAPARRVLLPPEVVTAARIDHLARTGRDFKVPAAECESVGTLDSGHSLYGRGYLISRRAAQERLALETELFVRDLEERAELSLREEWRVIRLSLPAGARRAADGERLCDTEGRTG